MSHQKLSLIALGLAGALSLVGCGGGSSSGGSTPSNDNEQQNPDSGKGNGDNPDGNNSGNNSGGDGTPPVDLTSAATPVLNLTAPKKLTFTWSDSPGAIYYKVLANIDGQSGFTQIGNQVSQGAETVSFDIPLHLHQGADYILQTCDASKCLDSNTISLQGDLINGIGYFKSPEPHILDRYGHEVAVSGDGKTMVVSALLEDSPTTGINNPPADDNTNLITNSGAVYVYHRHDTNGWELQAYIKASNTGSGDRFGADLTLSEDGNTLAVSAPREDSGLVFSNGQFIEDQAGNGITDSGAVYVFSRSGNVWSQQDFLKSSRAEANEIFGNGISLSDDGNTLAVGAWGNSTALPGVGAGTTNTQTRLDSGAAYIFTRTNATWSQEVYIKPDYVFPDTLFGYSVSLSGNGQTLAVGAIGERSDSGINGDESNNNAFSSGAVFIYDRGTATQSNPTGWQKTAYIKASNPEQDDNFGNKVVLNYDGSTLLTTIPGDDTLANGINPTHDNNLNDSGAVAIFVRQPTPALNSNWSQQAFIKGPNYSYDADFGFQADLTADGNMAVIGARFDKSAGIGVNGSHPDIYTTSGAVHIYTRNGAFWSNEGILKASNPDSSDNFGAAVAISDNGETIAVGAWNESGGIAGINGDASDNSKSQSGAVYLY